MITHNQFDFSSYKQSKNVFHLNFTSRFLVKMVRLLPFRAAYKLDYIVKMLNFLRAIGLYVYKQNSEHLLVNQTEMKNTERITISLIDFLINFEILSFSGSKIKVNQEYKNCKRGYAILNKNKYN